MAQSRITAQTQKEFTVNEAVALFDLAISAAVDGFLVNSPPANPTVGACYIIGSNPTGMWVGQALALAGYTAGGWRFIQPVDGFCVRDKDSMEMAVFQGGAWEKGHVRAAKLSVAGNQVVGPRQSAVSDPSGGTIIDAEARAAISGLLSRLRQHGLIAS